MKSALLETNKVPGVHYAFTAEGVELPVVDVTHPAFALSVTESEQQKLLETFLSEGQPFAFLPKPLRGLALRFFLRGSILATAIQHAQGTFMTGMYTYLLKLGPKMLGSAYAKPIDRTIAASLPALAARLRLQDISTLMAEALQPALHQDPLRPLHLINIAGGPAIDSLNTLILINQQPGLLSGRDISIDVLDPDDAGPAFGKAALAALSEPSGPLHGTRVKFRHLPYDWCKADDMNTVLRETQAKRAHSICSSEGGLFEYGSDTDIERNLKILREYHEVAAVVGSVTRADEPTLRMRQISAPATRPRGLTIFRALAEKAGWSLARAIERPFSDQVMLN